MMYRTLAAVMFLVGVAPAHAQEVTPAHAQVAAPARAQVTEEDVGDPDSFGRAQTYLGVVQAGVFLEPDCSVFPPGGNPCIELAPAPGVTSVDEADLGTILLPKRATKSLICFTFTPFASWEWFNDTGVAQDARMFLRPAVRVESEVLEDPSLINPVTGLPFDGVLMDSTISTFLQIRTLDPGEFDLQSRSTTRACTGGLVSQRVLRDSYGLSKKLIRDFFKKPITLSFGVRGNVSMVTSASFSVGVRLYGD